MEKEKRIEEMRAVIKKFAINQHCNKENIYKSHLITSDSKGIATALYNAGYRKIPENAVVLTRKEYASLVTRPSLNTAINVFDVRKETAEKFAEKVKAIKIRLDLIGNPYEKKYTQADLKEVANGVLNQFLRYIDEICKEITEGKV